MHPNESALNEYVEGSLDAAERGAVERHLRECAACREAVDRLEEIREVAGTLGPIQPPEAAWRRIERALQPAAVRSAAPQWSWWLAAAAVVLMAAGAAVLVDLRSRPAVPPSTAAAQTNEQLAASVEAELRQAESHYQNAIAGLEQIANQGKGSLDPQTAATLEKNLSVIDQAISESRAALRAQPDSAPAQQSLLDSFKSKIALLQETVALINEMRKGNDAGAARIVSGIKQKS
jgi:anti-sigma factor RsiW